MAYTRAYHDGIAAMVAGGRRCRQDVAAALRFLRSYRPAEARELRESLYWIGYPARQAPKGAEK